MKATITKTGSSTQAYSVAFQQDERLKAFNERIQRVMEHAQIRALERRPDGSIDIIYDWHSSDLIDRMKAERADYVRTFYPNLFWDDSVTG